MIISKESPLRRIPSALNMRQTLFLDAIRYSVEMSFIAYSRLKETLLSLTLESTEKASKPHIPSENIMLDAWAIIDSIHRLRILLEQFPYMKQKSSGLVLFYKQTEKIKTLRNNIQHINRDIDSLVENKIPVLGSLSWIVCLEADKNMFLCNLQTGTIFTRSVPFVRLPKKVQIPIDKISLIHKESICLSDVMSQTKKLVAKLENNLATQIEHLPQAGADVLVILEIKPSGAKATTKIE